MSEAVLSLDSVSEQLRGLRAWMRGNPCTEDSISDLVALLISVVESLTAGRYRNMVDTADDLVVRTDAFKARLQDVAGGATSWAEAIDDYEAADAVPYSQFTEAKGWSTTPSSFSGSMASSGGHINGIFEARHQHSSSGYRGPRNA